MKNSHKFITLSSYLFFGLVILLIAWTISCSSKSGPEPNPDPVEHKLRYNEVSFKQTHNSYIEDGDDKYVPCLDIAHGSIESQLTCNPTKPWDGGASGVELDIFLTSASTNSQTGEYEAKWDVKHAGEYDPREWPTFAHYLNRLKEWSYTHPGHNIITIKIEEKKYTANMPSWLSNLLGFSNYNEYKNFYETSFVPNFPKLLDAYIEKHFDTGLLYTPKQLKGSSSTLLAGANAGWPTLEELEGKFIFFVMGEKAAENYTGDRPEDRLCFQRGGLDDENCVFTSISGGIIEDGLLNSEYMDKVRSYHEQQPAKIISTYLGHHSKPCPFEIPWWLDWTGVEAVPEPVETELDWAVAMACGVNIIQTDKVNSDYATNGTQGFWPIMKKQWEREKHLTQAVCTNGPSAAVYRGVIHVMVNSKGDLKYHTMNSAGVLSSAMSTPAECSGDVRVAVYRDVLWTVFKGAGGTNLWVMSYDGNSFVQTKIGTANDTPGIAVFQNKLYIVYPRKSDKKLVYRTYDGSDWTGEMFAGEHGYSSHYGPALCVFDNRLQILIKGETNNDLYLFTFDGSNWSRATNISHLNSANTGKAPAAVVNGDEMLVVFRGGGNRMWNISVKANGQISGQRAVTVGRTEKSVSLVNYGGEIVMFHRGSASGDTRLYVQYLDADY